MNEPEFEPLDVANAEEPEALKMQRRRDSAIWLGLAIACLLIAFACATRAEGAYNYNVSIMDKNKNVSIGDNVVIDAYIAYQGKPVKDYPCIVTFFDYLDNATMFSERVYTDELGQLHYSEKLTDAFLYTNNYTYSLRCANTTELGTVYANIGSTPNWFFNPWIYFNANSDWTVLFIITGILLVAAAVAVGRSAVS